MLNDDLLLSLLLLLLVDNVDVSEDDQLDYVV
jgi:hypothetical protein